MSQATLIDLMTELDAEDFLTRLETKANGQEDETLHRCELWLDECIAWVS
jgi:hypothetical protein